MFKYLKSLFSALNANTHPGDVAHAVSLALLLALVPKANLLWSFLFLFTIFIRINKASLFLSLILFAFVVPFADVPVDALGGFILSLPFMQGAYETLYGIPFVGLTRFNNTMVAGGLIAGLILYAPVYALFRTLIVQYRAKLQAKVANSKAVKILRNLPLIKQIINAPSLKDF